MSSFYSGARAWGHEVGASVTGTRKFVPQNRPLGGLGRRGVHLRPGRELLEGVDCRWVPTCVTAVDAHTDEEALRSLDKRACLFRAVEGAVAHPPLLGQVETTAPSYPGFHRLRICSE